MDNNPMFEFHPQDYVNDPFVIAQNNKQVAINSALEVDLTGQVCADSIGHNVLQRRGRPARLHVRRAAFAGWRADHRASRNREGWAISRIVPMLKHGAGVVTTRNHVRYVVTEYGVADLFARTIRERVHSLVNIAAPQFREELLHFAKQQHWI
jgi:4-hydroxybutyrate CoA-transferase